MLFADADPDFGLVFRLIAGTVAGGALTTLMAIVVGYVYVRKQLAGLRKDNAAADEAEAEADDKPIDQYRQLAKELRAEVRAVRTELQKVYQALADVRGEHDECRRALAIVTAQNANQQKQLDAHRDALRAAGLDAGSGPNPALTDETGEHDPLPG